MNKYWENEISNYVNEKLRDNVTEGYEDRFPKEDLPPRAKELHEKALRYIAEAEAAIAKLKETMEEE
jgi:light-regulated signal transduction histidine kinase (bacteriophytochrome)